MERERGQTWAPPPAPKEESHPLEQSAIQHRPQCLDLLMKLSQILFIFNYDNHTRCVLTLKTSNRRDGTNISLDQTSVSLPATIPDVTTLLD